MSFCAQPNSKQQGLWLTNAESFFTSDNTIFDKNVLAGACVISGLCETMSTDVAITN
jgi:hypothetical protein